MSGSLLPAIELGFPEVGGSVAAGFEPLVETFAESLARSHGHGGALHIRVAGNVVADLWGGNASPGQSWQQDTPTVIFSCTKGLVAILIGELVCEGRLDLDASASAYWPEFAARGKDSIPVRWLLSHRAGLPATRRDLQIADIVNWDRMVEVLADEEPLLPPDTGHVYHALTYGWLAGGDHSPSHRHRRRRILRTTSRTPAAGRGMDWRAARGTSTGSAAVHGANCT